METEQMTSEEYQELRELRKEKRVVFDVLREYCDTRDRKNYLEKQLTHDV